MDRRRFLRGVSLAIAASPTLSACAHRMANSADGPTLTQVETETPSSSRPWIGAHFWANRLQDWERAGAEIRCRRGSDSDRPFRTAHVLTRRLEPGFEQVRLSLTCRNLVADGAGVGGLLIGAGGADLDYRSATLIQQISGTNGGIIACIDERGMPQFRAFDDPVDQLDAALFDAPRECVSQPLEGGAVTLDLLISNNGAGQCDLRLLVFDAVTGEERGCAVLPGLAESRLMGNIALVSSASGDQGARFAFRDLAAGGDVMRDDSRAIGPVAACLHSLNRDVMKLTAQMMPVAQSDLPRVRLDWHDGAIWQSGPTADVGDGYAALFRVEGWDASQTRPYRIVDPANPSSPLFEGEIRADPGTSRPLSIALHSCLLPTARQVDQPNISPRIPQEKAFGRYSPDNLLYPHVDMAARCEEQAPDLYVFCGDQYYETYPTSYGRDGPDAVLDTLYRWYLFLLTWREPLRDRPAIVLADDHDVLQGNLWGDAGDGSDLPREEDGGFKHDKALIRTVYRVQCGHNPDPYDPEPIAYDIPVSYGQFIYGGTSFAFIEDRKFKDPPDENVDLLATTGELLGARQEQFLADWANMDEGMPKVCLTASIWGSPQTAGNLEPLVDYDANGYPGDGRNRAVRLLRDAGAVALAGDQHLAMLAVMGVDAPDDGPLFFAGPAGAAFWQRWFEGLDQLRNQRNGDPDTGDFTDCFGNPMRVLAVANPRIGYEEFMASKDYWGNFLGDHRLKSEGFGIARVDHSDRAFHFECWPRDRAQNGGGQYPGWPYRHPFT